MADGNVQTSFDLHPKRSWPKCGRVLCPRRAHHLAAWSADLSPRPFTLGHEEGWRDFAPAHHLTKGEYPDAHVIVRCRNDPVSRCCAERVGRARDACGSGGSRTGDRPCPEQAAAETVIEAARTAEIQGRRALRAGAERMAPSQEASVGLESPRLRCRRAGLVLSVKIISGAAQIASLRLLCGWRTVTRHRIR